LREKVVSTGKVINSIFCGKLKHFSRFSTVGVLNTLIDFIVFSICQSIIGFNNSISQILGYSFGILNSFILNKRWTFEVGRSGKRSLEEFIEFIVVNMISLIISVAAINFLVNNIEINVYLSKTIVILITQMTNFIGYKMWVFNKREPIEGKGVNV
jgi:putative flippase GtrA